MSRGANRIRAYLLLFIGLMPMSRCKIIGLRRVGNWTVAGSVTVKPNVIWNVFDASLGHGSRIGFGNVLANIKELTLGERGTLGKLNWVTTSWQYEGSSSYTGIFRVGRHSAVTTRHILDCSGGILIGDFTTVAGMRTTVITHQIDYVKNSQTTNVVQIGNYCLISACVRFTPGSSVPDFCLVAMGSTVTSVLPDAGCLYTGTPATAKKRIDGSYFSRGVGAVSWDGRFRDTTA